jgi:pyridoxal phosphate enzyme (YggS family)
MMSATADTHTGESDAVAARLGAVITRIRAAEQRFGREPDSVRLLAVSKVQPLDKIIAARRAGQRAFGESYVQEGIDKMAALAKLAKLDPTVPQDLEWHFIGRIQGNKTRLIAEHFDWVHGLCDLRHAHRLGEQRPAGRPPLDCCIQVNLSGETSKAGLRPEETADFIAACRDIDGIRLHGLMTLPARATSLAKQRRPFAELRALRDRLATPEQPLQTLSMGMSDDLEAAIAEGATIVRIGTAVFGPRPTPQQQAG